MTAGPSRHIRRAAQAEADVHVPVAIVGGGACGLTAALMLSDAGVDCVVLERDALPSGSTALSSGFIPAPGTRTQRAHGVLGDSAERFAADIQAKAHGRAAPALVEAYAASIGPALDALQERHGLQWLLLDGFLYPGHSVHRMHALPQKTGASLMAALQAAVEAAGIPVLTQALVDTLVLDAEDRVIGVDYSRPDGRRETLGCDALLLACNGFGGNPEMVRTLLPEMAEASFGGHAGNDGSAILWGEALGARLRDLGGYQGHGSWVTPQGALMSWAVMMEGGVQLNREGRRFHDETEGYSKPPCTCSHNRAALRGTCSTHRCLHWRGAFPISARPRRQAHCAAANRWLRWRIASAASLRCCKPRSTPCAPARHRPTAACSHAHSKRRTSQSRSRARCSTPRAASTPRPTCACCGRTARPSPTCLPPVARRAAFRVMRSGAIFPATVC